MDTTEDNFSWTPFGKEEVNMNEQTNQQVSAPGIVWLSASPSLDNAPYVTFSEDKHKEYYNNSLRIYDVILAKFVPKYKQLYQEPVLSVWKCWLEQQKQLWTYSLTAPACAPRVLPRPFATRQATQDPQAQLDKFEDCAPADPEEALEIITHSSGIHGQFTDEQRLCQIRQAIATAEEFRNPTEPVTAKKACIFVHCYFDIARQKNVHQIGVGIVENIQGDPASPSATFDLIFCPPKGSLPAKGIFGSKSFRADTLYQDITCDMSFNQQYTSKKGKKVESENKNIEKTSLLAFNLILNKQGNFCKKRDRKDSLYNMSSYIYIYI